MKRLLLFTICLLCASSVYAIDISRLEPACWWVGMKNPELQIMVYGKNIASSQVYIDYPGVRVKEIVGVENPNYLFLYLDISRDASPGTMNLIFQKGKEKEIRAFELKERNKKVGAAGFSPADVMYLITPDRFANADPSNDNLDDVKIDRSRGGARHGGDLRGIINKLDYIRDLGFTTIWLNPVLENRMPGGSYHGYAITDFYQVDPRFGTNEEYCELIDKAHEKGMKVVMDMIFNHIGANHPWVLDVPSKDWFNVSPSKRGNHAKAIFYDNYASTYDSEVMKYAGFGIDLNQANPHVGKYLIQNSIWWIEYARIDAIRQDTYPYSDFDMMREWNIQIMNEYPQFNIVGEIWTNYTIGTAWWQKGGKLNFGKDTELKSVMDFTLMSIASDIFNDKSSPEGRLDKIYDHLCYDFVYPDIKNVLRFLDNHDTDRFLRSEPKDLDGYKQGVAFLLTIPGTPQLYYGHELLMSGTKSRPGGDGNIRLDVPGGWPGDSQNWFTREGRSDLQNKAWDYLQTLLKWRKGNKIISEGNMKHYMPQLGVYVYERYLEGKSVMVIINGANHEVDLPLARYKESLKEGIEGKDIITKRTILFKDSLKLASKEVLVVEMN